MENKTRVLLADANEDFRMLLQEMIERTGEFEVVGSTADGEEALQLMTERKPQLLLLSDRGYPSSKHWLLMRFLFFL